MLRLKPMRNRAVLVCSFFLVTLGGAKATDLITQPEAAMLVSQQNYDGTYINRMGNTSVANPSWIIQQTGQGSIAFGPGANYGSAPGSSWQVSNNTGRVQFYAAPSGNSPQNTYELAQNGQSSSIPCSQEEDLNASSIQPNAFKDQNGVYAPSRTAQSTTLGKVSTVNLQVGLVIPYENIVSKCSDVNAAGYAFEVGVRSVNGYFFYYQVIFRDSRGFQGSLVPCGGYPIGKTYCFSTSASTIGGPANQAVSSNRTFYNLNLLSSITHAIARTPDTNLADWRVEAGYFGQSTLGGATNVSDWDSVKVSVY